MRRPILLLSLVLFCGALSSQVLDTELYRTYDGSFNNPNHPEWGQVGTHLLRLSPPAYADSISAPAAPDRTNPRVISNSLFAQGGLINDPMILSDYCWAWGQFLDHDISLTSDGDESLNIPVPAGDPNFDPLGFGQMVIPMHRNRFDPTTGTDTSNPRQHSNEITVFIDGSAVYGSDEESANWLRSFEGGKMKVSNNNMLPFNTVDGLYSSEVDPSAPHMEEMGISPKFYVAGDPRANENPLLLSFHTLFVREHNRQAERLARQHPDWSDEEIYQYARKMVGGLIQRIVYEEWLPVMGVQLDEYTGYNIDINPQASNEFTAAAFRLGHTLLNSNILRIDDQGNEIPQGHLTLRDAFFNPFVILETGDIDPFFKGMGTQVQQRMDPQVIDDVRNFLFGPPGAGGLDLVSININRGRERGLPDFNTLRQSLGLTPYDYFQQINSNAVVFTKLLSLYNNTDNIDPWVGLLSERAEPGALFGETIMAIMKQQFRNLRDGDRFYYLIDPLLADEDIEFISRTSLRDIIMYNTNIFLMQDNVFRFKPHDEICETMTLNIRGEVKRSDGALVQQVDLTLDMGGATSSAQVDPQGEYDFGPQLACELNQLTANRNNDPNNGVSTFDIILFQKHLLNVEFLDSPYKIIAGDIDDNGNLSTLDLIRMRRLILGIDTAFAFVPSWRFVPASYEFQDPLYPLDEDWPETIEFSSLDVLDFVKGFVAVKMGDANYSATTEFNNEETVAPRTRPLQLLVSDRQVKAGDRLSIPIRFQSQQELIGYQFALELSGLSIENIRTSAGINANNFVLIGDQELRVSWHDLSPESLTNAYLELDLYVEEDGLLSERLSLGDYLQPEAYTSTSSIGGLDLVFETIATDVAWGESYPNPFRSETHIPFQLASADQVQLVVYDALGRLVYAEQRYFTAGNHQWILQRADLTAKSGWLQYQIQNTERSHSGKLLLLD